MIIYSLAKILGADAKARQPRRNAHSNTYDLQTILRIDVSVLSWWAGEVGATYMRVCVSILKSS